MQRNPSRDQQRPWSSSEPSQYTGLPKLCPTDYDDLFVFESLPVFPIKLTKEVPAIPPR